MRERGDKGRDCMSISMMGSFAGSSSKMRWKLRIMMKRSVSAWNAVYLVY